MAASTRRAYPVRLLFRRGACAVSSQRRSDRADTSLPSSEQWGPMSTRHDEDDDGLVHGWPDLLAVAGASDIAEFGDWLYGRYELDPHLETDLGPDDEGDFVVRIDQCGTGFTFPFTLEEFWRDLADLHQEAEAEYDDPDDPGAEGS
jgi:hypothetical protein